MSHRGYKHGIWSGCYCTLTAVLGESFFRLVGSEHVKRLAAAVRRAFARLPVIAAAL
jgi:hypothetical protein